MYILYITQTFPPEPGPTIRPLEQAQELVRMGHEVLVLTAFPSYPMGRLADGDRGRLHRWERVGGIDVLRVFSFTAPTGIGAKRLLSWSSFAASALLAGLLTRRPDVVLASVPNAASDAAGLLVARLRKARFALELRDLLPESILLSGVDRSSWLYRLARRFYDALYRRCDVIAVPYEAMLEVLAARPGLSRDRLVHMPHGVSQDRFERGDGGRLRTRLGLEHKRIALYAGSFSHHYGVVNLVEAGLELANDGDLHLVMIGDGVGRAQVAALAEGSSSVTVAPAVSPKEMGSWLEMADLFIAPIHYLPGCEYRPDRTTKVCDYLSFGRPILVVEDEPCIGPFIERVGAGWVCRWNDRKQLAETLCRRLRDDAASRSCAAAARKFSASALDRARTMEGLRAWLESLEGP